MPATMRTTLTLDPDVHKLLQKARQRGNLPLKQVLNDAVRAGLGAHRSRGEPFVQPVFSLGRSRVDLTKALALAGELDDRHQTSKRARP